jgi:hypothetical protein
MTKDKALNLALEALEWSYGGEPMPSKEAEAIKAIRQVLKDQKGNEMTNLRQAAEMALEAIDEGWLFERIDNEVAPALRQALAEPPNSATDVVEPEPFGWLFKQRDGDLYKLLRGQDVEWSEKNSPYWVKVSPLYTTPPKREWVTLSDDDIKEIVGNWGDTPIRGYTRKLFDEIDLMYRKRNYG